MAHIYSSVSRPAAVPARLQPFPAVGDAVAVGAAALGRPGQSGLRVGDRFGVDRPGLLHAGAAACPRMGSYPASTTLMVTVAEVVVVPSETVSLSEMASDWSTCGATKVVESAFGSARVTGGPPPGLCSHR